jgi:hypothetical protein
VSQTPSTQGQSAAATVLEVSEQARSALRDLDSWFDSTGFAGWDPYDIRGNRRFSDITSIKPPATKRTMAGTALEAAGRLWPHTIRSLFGVKPHVNSKGMGLYVAAQVRLAEAGSDSAMERASKAVDWLVANTAEEYPGSSWGYPFPWYSRVEIPAGTPSSTATVTVADALLDYAEATADEHVLEVARGAATFILGGLHLEEFGDGSVCFSYTPFDRFHVYNSSLLCAEYLNRAARLFDEPEWDELALRALRYVAAEQCPDGSFEYWGEDQRRASAIDNYHTGFVLRSLFALEQGGLSEATEPLESGWEFYRTHLFDGERPLQAPGITEVLNIHSCAESVLCPAVLSRRFPGALDVSAGAASWTIDNMRNADGTFIYGLRKGWREKMVYWRWSQAWMLRSLSELSLRADTQADDAPTG